MDFVIKPLSPELLDDYLFFFDNMVFTEHPDWSKCYCYSFHFTGTDEQWNKEDNRAAVIKLIKADKMHGYLAYHKDVPVAWCNVNDRVNYERLMSIYNLDVTIGDKVCSIVCFLVSPEFRRKGIAKLILERIIKDYSLRDYDYLEAYPAVCNSSCEKNYKGPLSLYKNHNFRVIKECDNYSVVQRQL